MKIHNRIKSFILILLLIISGGAGYAGWLWWKSDVLLRELIMQKIAERAPDWKVTIEDTHYNWDQNVTLYGVKINTNADEPSLVTFPEIIITLNREALFDRQEVLIQKVRLLRPEINLVRNSAGRWNFEDLSPIQPAQKMTPEIDIEQATVHVLLQHGNDVAPGHLVLNNANLKLVPSGTQQFLLQGLTHINQAGNLTVDGEWNIEDKTWSIHGKMQDVTSNGELSSLAIGIIPQLKERVTKAHHSLRKKLIPRTEKVIDPLQPFSMVSAENPLTQQTPLRTKNSANSETNDEFVKIGVEATVNVEFRMSQFRAESEPDFAIHVDITKGAVTNSILPFPLNQLTGSIDWNNQSITLNNLKAVNQQTELKISGSMQRTDQSIQSRYNLIVNKLILDKRLRSRLPQSSWKLYDTIQPTGQVDINCNIENDAHGQWTVQNFICQAEQGTVAVSHFPYPITHIQGTARQIPNTRHLEVAFTGLAGKRPVQLAGFVKNVGPEAEMGFDVRADHIPIDEHLLAACKKPVRKALESLNTGGQFNARIRLYRPPGLKKKIQTQLIADLSDGKIRFDKFPYPIDEIKGRILFDSRSLSWNFRELVGRHQSAQIGATGSFIQQNKTDPGLLSLTILADNARCNRALEHALPDHLQEAWDLLSPEGDLQLTTKIYWRPGEAPEISIPKITLTNASILLRNFPYALENATGKFSYENDQVEIISFYATHDDTRVSTSGFVQCPHNRRGDWRVRLNELYAKDITPDHSFRRALPNDLRDAIESLNPQGALSLVGMLELRGTTQKQDPVTAAWDLEFLLPENNLTTGVDLKNIQGHLFVRGTYDGKKVDLAGQSDLQTVTVWGYTLNDVRGPFRLVGNQLVVGSREALIPQKKGEKTLRIEPKQRITAKFVGGILTLDAAAVLKEVTPYHVKATMSHGRLERFAKLYMPGTDSIKGIVNGWVDLRGRGPKTEKVAGVGQLQIHPAALYELPVMAQMFKVMSFAPPDKTAFNYAFADFIVSNNAFHFNTIDLVGDAISFRGKGVADFNSDLKLDFYSMMPRNRVPIPIIGMVLGEATKGWVGIQVRGKTDQPVARVTTAPTLDEAMKVFTLPQLLIQPLTPAQVEPLQRGTLPRRYRLQE